MSLLKKCLIVFISLIIIQCGKENQFLVEKGAVGKLNKQTSIKDLNLIFSKDSISTKMTDKNLKNKLFSVDNEEYIVFSKKGIKLLEIVPTDQNDSLSKIKSIQIFDSNYKTERGVSLKSNFKEINESYLVNKVETTLTSATLFIDELNATISIDKKELGLNTFSRDEISIDQIPDIAKIKYFTIWFN